MAIILPHVRLFSSTSAKEIQQWLKQQDKGIEVGDGNVRIHCYLINLENSGLSVLVAKEALKWGWGLCTAVLWVFYLNQLKKIGEQNAINLRKQMLLSIGLCEMCFIKMELWHNIRVPIWNVQLDTFWVHTWIYTIIP